MNSLKDEIKPIDLTEVLRDYEGKWVVLSKDYKKVLASGKTVDEILEYIGLGFTLKVSEFVGSFTPSTTI